MSFIPTGPANPALVPLRQELRKQPDHPDLHYQLAVILLNSAQLKLPTRQHKRRARELLMRSIELRPEFAPAHALLSYVLLELDQTDAAIRPLRKALKLSPGNEIYEDFLLETLDWAGRTDALRSLLQKVARQRAIDLAEVGAELRRAGLAVNPSSLRKFEFPAGERHFVSGLMDEVEKIERRYCRPGCSDAVLAQSAQSAISIDARRVPAKLRPLIPLVQHWGLSDDSLRGEIIAQASARDRAGLRKALPATLCRHINDWLDSFADAESMSEEAAQFMYLLQAREEI